MTVDVYLTAAQAAEALGIDQKTLWRWTTSGRVACAVHLANGARLYHRDYILSLDPDKIRRRRKAS